MSLWHFNCFLLVERLHLLATLALCRFFKLSMQFLVLLFDVEIAFTSHFSVLFLKNSHCYKAMCRF
uniref:Putative ovule protein n=1 Tax=Solanum chacoense TaxID=4108 RepID=A0A0V0GZ09_SOLCH